MKKAALIFVVLAWTIVGSVAVAQEKDLDHVILDSWDMLEFSYTPGGTVYHTIRAQILDASYAPYTGANPRLYYYNWQSTQGAYFCDDWNLTRSENFYASEDGNGYYTFYFALAGGIDRTAPLDNMTLMFEWGQNWSLHEHFYNVVGANPDFNADGVVGLSDAGAMASYMNGSYAYDPRADFNHDGSINVSDSGFFSAHMSETCQ